MAKLAFFVTDQTFYGVLQTSFQTYESVKDFNNLTQATLLVSFIEELLIKADRPQLSLITTPCGPGRFTSLRVTLSTAQGLELSYPQAKCFSPSLFDVLFSLKSESSLAIIDSKRGDYFIQSQGQEPKIILKSDLELIEDFKKYHLIPEPDLFFAFDKKYHYDPLLIPYELLKLSEKIDYQDKYPSFHPFYLYDPVYKTVC